MLDKKASFCFVFFFLFSVVLGAVKACLTARLLVRRSCSISVTFVCSQPSYLLDAENVESFKTRMTASSVKVSRVEWLCLICWTIC